MATQTPAEYHADYKSWGGYQSITLKDLVDDMLADTTDSDSYLANTKRSQIVRQIKRGIRTINKDTNKMYHAVQITVGTSLYFALPQNYVDWERVSVIDENDRMQPLGVNNRINTSDGYLQNHKYEILFNHDGELLTTDMANAYQVPYIKHTVNTTNDTSLLSKFGEFKVNDDRGTIHFSSDLEDKCIVIEYRSDGLDMQKLKEQEIKIHKDFQEAVKWFAISEIISTRKSVNQYDKTTARNRFLKEKHEAMIKALKFDFLTIGRVINSKPK
jgi:RecG-like helicase